MRAYRNARYHDDRLAHFERLTRWSNFGLIVLGSAALAGVIQTFAGASGQHSDIGAVLAIGGTSISAIVSAGQLAFDWSAKARAHSELRRAFSKIMAKAANTRLDTDEINAEMVELYGDEFEVYHAVNALAYNAAQRAFDRKDKIYELSWWQAVTRHIRHQDTRNFQLVDDPT